MVTTIQVFANSNSGEYSSQVQNALNTEVTTEGRYCNGTVGCACSGFAPITGGEVWQQAYCRKCSHHRRVHK